MPLPSAGPPWVLDRKDLGLLLASLRASGYRVIGPRVRDGAILYDEVKEEGELPIGWRDRQEAGTYRLERSEDLRVFDFHLGPQGWKPYLFPPHHLLWTARKDGGTFRVEAGATTDGGPLAFLGVRACEVAALRISERVFEGGVPDPTFRDRRASLLIVAVECSSSAPTCFCPSMRTGPEVTEGFDIVLRELFSPWGHRFLVEAGTDRGRELLQPLPLRAAAEEDLADLEAQRQRVREGIHRGLPVEEARGVILANLEHPRWEEVGRRCLACANCTMVCPTCFCSTTEEVPSLSGEKTQRYRRWDSCFGLGFTQLHASSVRSSIPSRYRQWMSHKLATWWDQFGSSGCVGCGRCITWCPVGIDFTEEFAALRTKAASTGSRAGGVPA